MNYATLVGSQATAGSIANWMQDTAIVASAPAIVEEAESWIYRRLRHWKMLTSAIGTLTVGQAFLGVPTDLIEPALLTITGIYQAEIEQRTKEDVIANIAYDGTGARVQQQPMMYYQDQTNFNFDNPPDQAYPYLLNYYQQPVALATSNTNFLTTFYQRALRSVLMAIACEFKHDVGQGQLDRTYWLQVAEGEIQRIQMESDKAIRSIHAGSIVL